MDRISFIVKNLKYFAFNFILLNILKVALRVVFIKTLSIEYLGIHSLLLNVLATLSLIELGVGPAIIYSLYQPLANRDKIVVRSIMHFFKKMYYIIGTVILVIGVILYPWIDNLIKDRQVVPDFNLFYLLFLFNTVISYFLSYKRNIFIADQRQYIVNKYQMIIQTLIIILQMFFLYVFENYWYFIFLMVLGTIFENLLIYFAANKSYPYLNEGKNELDSQIKNQIIRNIKAMIFHKLGGIITFNSGSLVLSKIVGIVEVGLYSNYFMIVVALNNFAGKFFEAIIASIGNLIVTKNSKDKIMAFKLTEFVTAIQANICFCCLYVLFNPFIELWVGKEYLLEENFVSLISLSFYLIYMRKAVQVFHDAAGLYWIDRYKPVVESVINLIASIFFTLYYGVIGVVMGSIIGTITVSFWVEPYVLFKNSIRIKFKDYILDFLVFSLVTFVSAIISKSIYNKLFYTTNLENFLIGIFICISITLFLWILVFKNREEMQYYIRIIRNRFF